jgi:hypothetical protein
MSAAQSTAFSLPRFAKRRAELFGATALLLLALGTMPALAQNVGLQPGEAFATRFSGTAQAGSGQTTIDTQGVVGSILDLRSPGRPAQGQHWIDEPQRAPVTAGEVGQVFGVALDDATPPNIYLTATAAFGLHRTADNAGWMPGMFGEGGPGAIYKLDAANGYKPQLFATVTLDGRPNSGAALGNIAYDRWNRQLLVSDLETGMIHRIGLDGTERDRYDHGTQGRANFVDASSGEQQSLDPIAFDPNSRARIADCENKFDLTPGCWNIAASGRRVWGLGVWRGPGGETRLYYSVASSPEFGNDSWSELSDDEQRNALWSVRLGDGGAFDVSSVRREFLLPDFFSAENDVARAGHSRPVSDITFPACSGRAVMLVAERGGLRNLGLAEENAFATPHESRTIRYELDQGGVWRVVGRYDIGMYDRSKEGAPFIHANCAGGATFGPGYTADGRVSTGQPDRFVWISGDSLCSPDGPCNAPISRAQAQQVTVREGGGYQPDDSEVHGVQGQPEGMYNALLPESANEQNQSLEVNPIGPDQAYMVDLDINVDQSGNVISEEIMKNDATRIGDVVIYQLCPVERASYSAAIPLMAVPVGIIHGRGVSHYRAGSHARFFSHWRWHSHSRFQSHDRRWSRGHHRWWSDGHWRHLSPSHRRRLSPTHWRYSSPGHWRDLSPSHRRQLSPTHRRHMSPTHRRWMSPTHSRSLSPSHSRSLSPSHKRGMSPSHSTSLSPSHGRNLSPSHKRGLSPTHSRTLSPQTPGITHLRANSNNTQVPKKGDAGKHRRGMSPGHITQTKSNRLKAGKTKRGPGGMGGMGGMGGSMGGMGGMGGSMGGMGGSMGGMSGMGMSGMGGMGGSMGMQSTQRRSMGGGAQRRIGPQQFRGGPGGGRRR